MKVGVVTSKQISKHPNMSLSPKDYEEMMKEKVESEFRQDLTKLINVYSKENGSDTPDYIIADYLIGCLETFNKSVNDRRNWYSGSDSK